MLNENADFEDIFKAAWFVLVTLSTVGYGDVYPATFYGQAVTVPIIITGVLFMAMPISIVGNNFTVGPLVGRPPVPRPLSALSAALGGLGSGTAWSPVEAALATQCFVRSR